MPICSAHSILAGFKKGSEPDCAKRDQPDKCSEASEKLGSSTHYKRLGKDNHSLYFLSFADTSRKDDHGQLCFLLGLVFGDLNSGSVFHTISWSSRKSGRHVKSVASAERLATVEALDVGKVMRRL